MPRIVLKDLETERTITIPDAEASFGRDPGCSVVVDSGNSRVVSGHHARVFFQDDAWWVEDTSRNGTILDDERLRKGERYSIKAGQVVGLGETGPRYRVLSLEGRRVVETMMEPSAGAAPPEPPPAASGTQPLKQGGSAAPAPERPSSAPASAPAPDIQTTAMRRSEALRAGLDVAALEAASLEGPTEPMGPGPDWVVHVVLRETHTNQRWDVRGGVIKIGRAPECMVQIPPEQGASVSRVHAEIAVADGGISVRDAGSRNGTFVNGKRIQNQQETRKSDLLMLGSGGPTFSIEELRIVKGAPPEPAQARAPVGAAAAAAASHGTPAGGSPAHAGGERTPGKPGIVSRPMGPATNLARRSFAGVGRTAFFKDVLEDMSRKSARRVRTIVWISVVMTVGVAAGVLWMTQQRVSASERRFAQERAEFEARADSIRLAATAEAELLRAAFDSARASSAPRDIVDSLRNALADASRRTGLLEVALTRAQQSLDQQLSAGETARRRAEEEMNRLRAEVGRAQSSGIGSRSMLDSLSRALRLAEERASEISNTLRTVRNANADLAQVAKLNQGAVGLVTMYSDTGGAEGSGFAITPSGYFVTNRHVVMTDAGRVADSLFVTMADQRYGNWLRADVVRVGSGDVDIAVLKLRNYRGLYVEKIDWRFQNARQGEPAALIGFPRGTMLALDGADTVRTSVSAGIFSKVTPSRIQFDGFSQGGSSGSAVFAVSSGEVVAVHFAGLRGAVGLGFAIPVSQVVPLLPAEARSELGIR